MIYIGMKLTIRTLKNETFEVSTKDTDMVKDLKKQIVETEPLYKDVAYESIKLIFEAKILENEKSIKDYNLKDNSSVVMMVSKPKNTSTNQSINSTPEATPVAEAPSLSNSLSDGQVITPNETADALNGFQSIFQTLLGGMQPTSTTGATQSGQNILGLVTNMLGQLGSMPEFNNLINVISNSSAGVVPDNQLNDLLHSVANNLDFNTSNEVTNPDPSVEENSTISFNEQEYADISYLAGLGFDQSDVIQYYLACNKNRETTANMLMEEMLNDSNV